MTQLPATIEEARAIGYVKGYVESWTSKKIDIMGVQVGLLDRDDARKFCVEQLKISGLRSADQRLSMISYALAGDGLSQDALLELYLEMTSTPDRLDLCIHVQSYIALIQRNPPARTKGQSYEPNLFRDRAILSLVDGLRQPPYNLSATRNYAARSRNLKPSACSIVANALGMSEDSVDKVWKRLKSHL